MRKLDDWLKSWLEYTTGKESPERMRLWSGIAAIAGVLQRRVYVRVRKQYCYPNLYIVLVGPPGVGKGVAMKDLTPWMRGMEGIHIAPDGMTFRSLYTVLEGAVCAFKDFEAGGDAIDVLEKGHHSLTAFTEELGVLLRAGDNEFIYTLCHVYDCPVYFHHKTQHAGESSFENACFNWISGTTPKGLKDIFSEKIMELGIAARMIIIYSDEKVEVPVFAEDDKNETLEKDLKFDLTRISQINGEYQFTPEAAEALVAWVDADMPPKPKDPRFEHYNSRRFVQIIKLCTVRAASKRQDPLITLEDFEQARSFLLEAEQVMPKAVESIGSNPYLIQQQTAIRYINAFYEAHKIGTPEAALRRRLSTELDPRYADMIINDLEKARWVSCAFSSPNRIFYPRGKEPEEDKPSIDPANGDGNTDKGD